MHRRSRGFALALLLTCLIPGTSLAGGVQQPPYYFGFSFGACAAAQGARCTRVEDVDATTGSIHLDEKIAAALAPSRGFVVGVAVLAGGFYLQTARRSVAITVTVRIDSATASTPTPLAAAATGSFSAVVLQAGAGSLACQGCFGTASRTIVSQGTPPALPPTPAIPPPIPHLPQIPPALPSASAPSLPGQMGPTTITLKFTVRAKRGRIPAGVMGIGAVLESFGALGGGHPMTPATPAGPPQPIVPSFLGAQQPMNDIGASRAAVTATVLSVAYS